MTKLVEKVWEDFKQEKDCGEIQQVLLSPREDRSMGRTIDLVRPQRGLHLVLTAVFFCPTSSLSIVIVLFYPLPAPRWAKFQPGQIRLNPGAALKYLHRLAIYGLPKMNHIPSRVWIRTTSFAMPHGALSLRKLSAPTSFTTIYLHPTVVSYPLRPAVEEQSADPVTASSFNMPFTTMGYYSWLFGKGDESDVHSASPIEGCMLTAQSSKPMDASLAGQTSNAYSSGWLQTPRGIGAFKTADQSLQAPKYRPQSAGFSSNSYPSDLLSEETSAARQMLAIAHSTPEQGLGSVTEMFPHDALSPRHFLTPTNSASSLDMQSVYGLRERSRKPLFISEVAREGVLKLIDRAHPKSRDGLEVSREHPLLALQVLQEFCDLFFSRFNVSYPLIHQATFDAAQVDPLLLTSILLLGATYASKESHLFAICIHDTMRTQILASDAFTTRPTLWMIQTILLVECFGKSRAGQLQHDMSHLFHGLLIKYFPLYYLMINRVFGRHYPVALAH